MHVADLHRRSVEGFVAQLDVVDDGGVALEASRALAGSLPWTSGCPASVTGFRPAPAVISRGLRIGPGPTRDCIFVVCFEVVFRAGAPAQCRQVAATAYGAIQRQRRLAGQMLRHQRDQLLLPIRGRLLPVVDRTQPRRRYALARSDAGELRLGRMQVQQHRAHHRPALLRQSPHGAPLRRRRPGGTAGALARTTPGVVGSGVG